MFLGGKLKLLWSKIVLTSKETLFFFLHSVDCCSLSSELKQSLSVLGTLFHRFHLPSQLPPWELNISPGHKSISTVLVSVPALGLNKVSPGKCQEGKTKREMVTYSLGYSFLGIVKRPLSLGSWKQRDLFSVDTERLYISFHDWKQENSSEVCPSLSPRSPFSSQ